MSQHIRRSMCSRRVAASYARAERVPSHVPGISPLRPISPMEPPIHDVYSHLNKHEKAAAGGSDQRRLLTHYALAGVSAAIASNISSSP